MMRWGWLLLSAPLAGCAAVSGFPRPIMSERQEHEEIAAYLGTAAVAQYETCVDKVLCRNTIVDARLRAVDLAFYRFQRKIYAQDSRVSLGSSVLTLALDSAAFLTTTGGLAAGAGLLTGGRDAFQKQLRSVSLPLLFDQMTAKRREVLLRIRLGQRMPVSGYTLFQALDDVSEYELAGSIPAAAAELSASVGQNARTAQIQLDALRAAQIAAATAATGAVPAPAMEGAPPVPGRVVYSSTSGSASVATVVPDASPRAGVGAGSVIYTTDVGPSNNASVIPVPVPPRPAATPAPAATDASTGDSTATPALRPPE